MVTHAPRWEIQESSLGIPHEEVRIDASGDRTLSAWYVPSRNGAAVLVGHGSGGSRERVLEEIRLLAKHGYGVLAFDLFGNGESTGHSNGLGDNAQPAVDAALDYVAQRPDVDPERIAAFGSSLGGEVLLEAAARDAAHQGRRSPTAPRARRTRSEVNGPGRRRAGHRLAHRARRAHHRRRAGGAVADRPDAAHRAATGAADLRRRRPERDPDQPRLPRRGRTVGGAVLDPRGRPHLGPGGAAEGVRGARDRVLERAL